MKVGDLVKWTNLTAAPGLCRWPAIGLIVSIRPNVHEIVTKRSIFNVLLGGEICPFRSDMLEVISESR